jgi:hypothetical protein
VLAQPGAVPLLALSWGHWGNTEPRSGHLAPPIVNRDSHVSRGVLSVGRLVDRDPVSLFDRAPFLWPDLQFARAARAATVKTDLERSEGPPPQACAKRS